MGLRNGNWPLPGSKRPALTYCDSFDQEFRWSNRALRFCLRLETPWSINFDDKSLRSASRAEFQRNTAGDSAWREIYPLNPFRRTNLMLVEVRKVRRLLEPSSQVVTHLTGDDSLGTDSNKIILVHRGQFCEAADACIFKFANGSNSDWDAFAFAANPPHAAKNTSEWRAILQMLLQLKYLYPHPLEHSFNSPDSILIGLAPFFQCIVETTGIQESREIPARALNSPIDNLISQAVMMPNASSAELVRAAAH